MTIDNYEFQNIKSFLKENNFILSNDLPRKVGNGQSNPTYILTDNGNKKFILRTQPKGDLVRGAHRLDREFNVLRGLSNQKFSVPKPILICEDKLTIGRDFYIMELGKFKIRVNAICPGTIKGSRMVRVIRDKSKFLKIQKKKIEKEFISMASMNCWIYEEDIGKMCSFLISKDGERISGQAIAVDGNATRMD